MPIALYEKSWPSKPCNGWKLQRVIINFETHSVKEIWCEDGNTAMTPTNVARKAMKAIKTMKAMKAKKTMKSMNMKNVNAKPRNAMKAKNVMKQMKASCVKAMKVT